MALFPDPTVKDMAGVQRNFDAVSKWIQVGVGTPEGTVKGRGLFLREDGAVGSSVYAKTTPANLNTGWVAVA